MSKDININVGKLSEQFRAVGKKVSAYRVFIFFLAVASLYGYILWRINSFANIPPSQSESAVTTTTQPHIDPDTLAKIQNLQDNSVSVQTLFDDARQNPFHE
jgi:hypothetical protein